MDIRLPEVKVLIWDFDGTLYKANAELDQVILEADYEVVMRHTGWDRAKTVEAFHKIYKVKTPSSTETASLLAGISISEAAVECEQYKDRLKYLTSDKNLTVLFSKLSGYTHYMLVNGIVEKTIESLARLGVPKNTFAEIVTSETVGVTKPNPKGFQYILQKTGLPPAAHLMIGDREAVDLVPAKSLGMRTCLVWSDTASVVADVTVPTVYDVVNVLG